MSYKTGQSSGYYVDGVDNDDDYSSQIFFRSSGNPGYRSAERDLGLQLGRMGLSNNPGSSMGMGMGMGSGGNSSQMAPGVGLGSMHSSSGGGYYNTSMNLSDYGDAWALRGSGSQVQNKALGAGLMNAFSSSGSSYLGSQKQINTLGMLGLNPGVRIGMEQHLSRSSSFLPPGDRVDRYSSSMPSGLSGNNFQSGAGVGVGAPSMPQSYTAGSMSSGMSAHGGVPGRLPQCHSANVGPSALSNACMLGSPIGKSVRNFGLPAGMGSPSRNSPGLMSMGQSPHQHQSRGINCPGQLVPSQARQTINGSQLFKDLGYHMNQMPPGGSMSGMGMQRGSSGSSLGMNYSMASQMGSMDKPLPNGGGSTSSGGGFDMTSDFPALANQRLDPSMFPSVQSRIAYGGVSTKLQEQQPLEFNLHSEDFPALPGTQSAEGGTLEKNAPSSTSTPSYDKAVKDGWKPKTAATKSGIQTDSTGMVSNIPPGMVTDQFGMIGLLTFIRAAETDPHMVTLALGNDLTTLGLNLISSDNLYHLFGSPFADSTYKPHEIEHNVPQEYLIYQAIRDKLPAITLSRYIDDTLFYLYYVYVGDAMQMRAAIELYQRKWRYYKDEKCWVTTHPDFPAPVRTGNVEKGTYLIFDAVNWRKVPTETQFDNDKFDDVAVFQSVLQHSSLKAETVY